MLFLIGLRVNLSLSFEDGFLDYILTKSQKYDKLEGSYFSLEKMEK